MLRKWPRDRRAWNHAYHPAHPPPVRMIGYGVTGFLLGFLVCFIAFVRGWL